MAKEPQAIFFDMDGTLVDSERHWFSSERDLLAQFDVPWTHGDQAKFIGTSITLFSQHMWDLAGKRQSPLWFEDQLLAMVVEKIENDLEFMPGAQQLVQEVADSRHKFGLVTASPRLLMEVTLHGMGNIPFDVAISKDDVQIAKPNPEGYLRAAEILGVDIEKCVVLEDSPSGIKAGLDSGALVIGVQSQFDLPDHPRLVKRASLNGFTLQDIYTEYGRI